jgi:hypothetical protein
MSKTRPAPTPLAIPASEAQPPPTPSNPILPRELTVKCLAVIASILEVKRKELSKALNLLQRDKGELSSLAASVHDIFMKAMSPQSPDESIHDSSLYQQHRHLHVRHPSLDAYNSWSDCILERIAKFNKIDSEGWYISLPSFE